MSRSRRKTSRAAVLGGAASQGEDASDGHARTAALRSSAAVLLCFLSAAVGLHVVISGALWWGVVAVVLAAVVASAAAIRHFSRFRALAPFGGAFVLLACCTAFFAPNGAILGILPSADTVEQFRMLLDEANRSIYRQAIPADADRSIVFLLCAGIGSLTVLAEMVAVTFRRPALAGVPVLFVLGIPAAIGRDLIDPVVFVATASAYLLLLSGPRLRGFSRTASAVAAGALAAALVLPVLVPPVVPAEVAPGRALTTGVNPVITLGNDLRQAEAQQVISYSTASGNPHYLRLVTLENFTGTRWAPSARPIDRANLVTRFAAPPGLSADVPRKPDTTTITVGALSSRWLPAPYPPSRITGLSRDWYWDRESYSIASPTISTKGQSYTVDSITVEPTPEQLLAAGTTVPATRSDYLALPKNLPGIISSTARAVAASSESNYAKAIALQQFFRNGQFDYSEQAPVTGKYDGTGMALIARFLEVKAGYCVHFASSMAVMARSLGIPARVAVGFLPGRASTQNGQRMFEVSTRDLHAWPELYFEGVGWVQFEPTPGRGSVSDYANVLVAGVPTPPAPDSSVPIPPAPVPAPAVKPRPAPSVLTATGSTVRTNSAATAGFSALSVLAGLSLLPALMRAATRRRLILRLRSSRASAIEAWLEVLATAADLRIAVPKSGTPRDAAGALNRTIAAGRSPLPADSAALTRLLAAVEAQAFAGGEPAAGAEIARDLTAVRAQLLGAGAFGTGLLHTLYPVSVWNRFFRTRRHALSAAG